MPTQIVRTDARDAEVLDGARQGEGVGRDDADFAVEVDHRSRVEMLGIDDGRVDVGEDLELVGHADVVAVGRHAVGDDAVAHLAFLTNGSIMRCSRAMRMIQWSGFRPIHAPPVERESAGGLGPHRVGQAAEVFDLDGDFVAVDQRADAGRRAGQDQVARDERHDRRDVGHQLAHREDHVAGGGHLAQLSVDGTGDQRVGRLELGLDPRAERAESVEALAARPLPVGDLQVARRHVVGDGVTEDVTVGRLGGDPTAALADDHRQLGLVLDLLRLGRQADGLALADDGAGRLEEQQRQLRDGGVVFGGVGGVIASDADDLARLDRRQQLDPVESEGRRLAFEQGEGRTVEQADPIIAHPAPAGRLVAVVAETDQSHASGFPGPGQIVLDLPRIENDVLQPEGVQP